MISRMRILIHQRWWLTKLFSLLRPYGLSFMSQGGLSFMRPFWDFFYTPWRRRRVPPALPTAWVPSFREPMPAPPSVPARGFSATWFFQMVISMYSFSCVKPAFPRTPVRPLAPVCHQRLHEAYRTRIDRPIRNVVFGVMPFRAQRLLTVVWYFTAIEPSVSPDLIL